MIYTRPRWEKKITIKLAEKGIEAYCPLNKVTRQWSDRKRTITEPLFKGYIFIHIDEDKKWDVKMIDGVLNYVYWNGQPAVVRDKEIDTIKKFLSEFSSVDIEEYRLDVKQKVIIKQGVLMDYKGIILQVFGNKAKVQIESMGVQLSAVFDKKNLEPAP